MSNRGDYHVVRIGLIGRWLDVMLHGIQKGTYLLIHAFCTLVTSLLVLLRLILRIASLYK